MGLISGAVAFLTLVADRLLTRWKTRSDETAAAAAVRMTDAEAEGRTTDALGAAFRTITESLTIIHDLRDRLGKVENDLLAARTEIETLQRANKGLISDKGALQTQLDLALLDKVATHARLDQARGDIRQLKQVIMSNDTLKMPKLALDDDEA